MSNVNIYQDVYVVWAYRTASGSFYGQFNNYSAPMLGAALVRSCLDDLNLTGREISQVILGQVAIGGLGYNPARRTASLAEMPSYVPTSTINMGCASGLKAVLNGFHAIKFGSSKLVICGGQENITMAPQTMHVPRSVASQSDDLSVHISMSVDGLNDGCTGIQMRERANQLAEHYNICREIIDKYAYDSVQKAAKAMEECHFNQEILIVRGCSQDETLLKRMPLTLEMLMHKPTLDETPEKPSTVTEANSAPVSDGAAALILCNRQQLQVLRKNPLARIVSFAEVTLSPDNFGIGSIVSIQTILNTTGWLKQSVDLFEIQEVFAVQAVIVIEKLQLDPRKVNISGGAIALGHPVGASSARMLITLIHNLRRLNLKRGIASVCTGQGMALAVAVETVNPKEKYFA